MNIELALLLAFGIGVVAGLRSLTAPAVVAWAAHIGWINLHGSHSGFHGIDVGGGSVHGSCPWRIGCRPTSQHSFADCSAGTGCTNRHRRSERRMPGVGRKQHILAGCSGRRRRRNCRGICWISCTRRTGPIAEGSGFRDCHPGRSHRHRTRIISGLSILRQPVSAEFRTRILFCRRLVL